MKNQKLAQIQFGETFAILIILYFVFIFGSQYYISNLEDNFQESKREKQDLNALERLDFTLNYPQFLYSKLNNKEILMSELNILAFNELDQSNKNAIFSNSEIILELYTISFDVNTQAVDFSNSIDQTIVIHNNTRQFYSNGLNPNVRVIPHTSIINVYSEKDKKTYLGILKIKNFYEN